MSLKLAAFFALLGMLLLTALIAVRFLRDAGGLADGAVPAMTVLASLIQLLACLAVTVFFLVFHRAQSR